MPFFGRLEHEAQPGVVALVLDASEPAATTLEAYAAGFAHTDPVEGAVSSGGQRLRQHGIQVLGQPRDPQPFRQFVKGVLGKAVSAPAGPRRRPCAPGDVCGGWRGPPASLGRLATGAGGAVPRRARRCRTAVRLPGAPAGVQPVLPRRPGAVRAEMSASSCEGTFASHVLWCPSASYISLCRTSIPIIAGPISPVKQIGTLPSSPHTRNGASSPGSITGAFALGFL